MEQLAIRVEWAAIVLASVVLLVHPTHDHAVAVQKPPVASPNVGSPSEPIAAPQGRVAADQVVRVAIRDRDMILRITSTGGCVLVPFGPRLSMSVTRDWVWFVRGQVLYRVSAHGGRIERVERVPFFLTHIRFHDGAVYGNRIIHDGRGSHLDEWVVEASDEPPREPPTCR